MKILYLTPSKIPFETFISGKNRDYRKPSKWNRSRLIDENGNPKKYDLVKFTKGCGIGKPYLAAKYLGLEIAQKNYFVKYSNGLIVRVLKGDFRIKLGAIVRIGNVDSKEMF